MEIAAKVSARGKSIYLIEVQGDVFPQDIQKITTCLDSVVALDPKHILFIFRECTWVTAYFIRIVLSFYSYIRRKGGWFIFVNVNEELASLLTSYGLAQIATITDDEAKAMRLIESGSPDISVDSDTKKTILRRVQERLKQEESGPQHPGSRADGQGSAARETKDGEKHADTETILGNIHQFEDTVEMEIQEEVLSPRKEPDHSIGHGTGISTDENPVEFLNVNDLHLEKDTDYEREIKQRNKQREKEKKKASAGPDREQEVVNVFSRLSFSTGSLGGKPGSLPGRGWSFEKGLFSKFLDEMPESILSGNLRQCVLKTAGNRKRGRTVAVCVDSAALSSGIAGWLLNLIDSGCVTHLICTLTAGLRDIENTFGGGFRSRKEEIFNGVFGISGDTRETFREIAQSFPERTADRLLQEMLLKHSGVHKDLSFLYQCMENSILVSVCIAEDNPACVEFADRKNREIGFSRTVALLSDPDSPVIILPGNGTSIYSCICEAVRIGRNQEYAMDSATVQYFAFREDREFEQILSGAGIEALGIEGEPSFLFPVYVEAVNSVII